MKFYKAVFKDGIRYSDHRALIGEPYLICVDEECGESKEEELFKMLEKRYKEKNKVLSEDIFRGFNFNYVEIEDVFEYAGGFLQFFKE
ncbi:hypothetical protein [Eubacterium barkeri]|uniref:Uncharacterized protein n=1 Tax=Eubacterium barkeri TaxID=1528 RepID=A0A1H3IQE3_EUBBA|nr:hypothetical protein [Eubacterium barkeri]SDY29489.1 hypothetical protein SAMN04488579_12427 [Eubacterium barkeri]